MTFSTAFLHWNCNYKFKFFLLFFKVIKTALVILASCLVLLKMDWTDLTVVWV